MLNNWEMKWFNSKRFCRDCRKNVIREFKELKELNRMRREARCTTWFCAVDIGFQYGVCEYRLIHNSQACCAKVSYNAPGAVTLTAVINSKRWSNCCRKFSQTKQGVTSLNF